MYLVLSSFMWSPTDAASSRTLLNMSMRAFLVLGVRVISLAYALTCKLY
jgi:hypothetical protein